MNIRKTSKALLLSAILTTALFAGCGAKPQASSSAAPAAPSASASSEATATPSEAPAQAPQEKYKVGLVTDIGGFGDKGYNDASLEGLKKAEAEFGIEIMTIESKEVGDYLPNVQALADAGCGLVITTGGAFSDPVSQVAPQYPDVKFSVLEASLEGIDNVVSIVSKEHEGGFLLGVLAGEITKTNKLGFISAIQSASFERFEVGYKAGIKSVNPEAEVMTSVVGNFTDVGKASEMAKTMYSKDVDFIAPVAGGGNQGVFQAAKEAGKLCFGAATGQFQLAPDTIIASQVKLVNGQAYYLVTLAMGEEWPGGHIQNVGLKEGVIDLFYNPDEKLSGQIPQEVKDKIAAAKQQIIDGKITVPATYAEWESYQAPML